MDAHPLEQGLQRPALNHCDMWIDSHAHLGELNDSDLTATLRDAAEADVGIIVSTATDCATARTVARQCDRHPMLRGAVGISPFDVIGPPATWYDDLTALLSRRRIVAIGEIGIDATNPRYPPLSLQQPMLEKQLSLARSLDLPAVIHSRGAEQRAVDICRSIGVTAALFHCFTGGREALAAIIDRGYYISLSGIITFKNSGLRERLRDIPLERLLIETDTPFLAPMPHRGKRNRPAWVRFVGEEVARLLGKKKGEVQKQLEENFWRLFGKAEGMENPRHPSTSF
ncbi:MAG: TatD family hydrolase [Chitinispirillaceae bacterium]|nr:TatD family hydrolase [Chitinispirillaceae bacterium]